MHKVKQDFKNIRVGAFIWTDRAEEYLEVVRVYKEGPSIRHTVVAETETEEGTIVEFILFENNYVHTLMHSKTWEESLIRGEFRDSTDEEGAWAKCELKYGINEHGLEDPDPVRQLAFAILRGDSMAIDIAKDVMARGI